MYQYWPKSSAHGNVVAMEHWQSCRRNDNAPSQDQTIQDIKYLNMSKYPALNDKHFSLFSPLEYPCPNRYPSPNNVPTNV